ncbi:MAG: hypothetical protein LBH84_06540 [Prevotellaceae bacterium]|nr:hypothetical protein [Prevotellaceae bacterium]
MCRFFAQNYKKNQAFQARGKKEPFAIRKIFNRKVRKGGYRKERKGKSYKMLTRAALIASFAKNLCALCGEKNIYPQIYAAGMYATRKRISSKWLFVHLFSFLQKVVF